MTQESEAKTIEASTHAQFLPPQDLAAEGYELIARSRHAKYRGKHRSTLHGAGALAFRRNSWMKSVQGDYYLKS